MGVKEERLSADFAAMQQLASDVIRWEPLGTKRPPEHYLWSYDLKSIVAMQSNGQPLIEQRTWAVEVRLANNHPWGKPEAFFRGPAILHPNVYVGGHICIDDHYRSGIGIPLESLCEHIGKMIAYQRYCLISPANKHQQLFDWIEATNACQLPTDPRDMLRARIRFGLSGDATAAPFDRRITFG